MSTEPESPFQARQAEHAAAGQLGQYRAVREGVGVMDFSTMPRVDIRGADATNLVNSLVTRDIAMLKPGQIAYSACCNELGKMRDDCTVACVDEGHLLYSGSRPEAIAVLVEQGRAMGVDVRVVTEETGYLAVQGPLSRQVLGTLANKDLSNAQFPYYTCREDIELSGIPVFMARIGFTAELGYEVSVDRDRALDLWDVLAAAGASTGLTVVDTAIDCLSIEGGLVDGAVDYDETVSPYECGLGWTVDEGKQSFCGREVLLRDKTTSRLRLTSVVLESGGEKAGGAKLFSGDSEVGVTTRAAVSPYLGGKTLAVARVDEGYVLAGTQLSAEWPGTRTEATVVSHPVYEARRERAKR